MDWFALNIAGYGGYIRGNHAIHESHNRKHWFVFHMLNFSTFAIVGKVETIEEALAMLDELEN